MSWIEAGRSIMVSALGLSLVACVSLSDPPALTLAPSPTVKVAGADEQSMDEARRLFDEGNTGLALVRIEAYLAVHPESASGHNLAGAICDRIGRFDLAQTHYEKALALRADYLPAINNFGLSKLQRARATERADLEQEADALLARALVLSSDPAELATNHAALRALLTPRRPPQAAVPAPPRQPPTAWLERRGESYSYLVTRPTSVLWQLAAFDLDPAMALVSPGGSFNPTRLSIVHTRARRLRAWTAIGEAGPRLFGATSGRSVLMLKPPKRPSWYARLARAPADAALRARAMIFKLARLP